MGDLSPHHLQGRHTAEQFATHDEPIWAWPQPPEGADPDADYYASPRPTRWSTHASPAATSTSPFATSFDEPRLIRPAPPLALPWATGGSYA